MLRMRRCWAAFFSSIVSAPLCTTVTGRSWGGLYSQQSICLSLCKCLLLIAVELNPGTEFFRGLFGPLNIEAFGHYLPASWLCFSVPLVQFTSHWTYRAHKMHFFFSSFWCCFKMQIILMKIQGESRIFLYLLSAQCAKRCKLNESLF